MKRKRSQNKIGGAVAADPGLVKNTWEWERNKKWGGERDAKKHRGASGQNYDEQGTVEVA